ncbi:MAG: hypothetical protein K2W95_34020 [Candidatus Obscuribacterales bacterium]|nr:hypothetical protein [Candidatus Obscuribacterales bacterium]
MEPRLQGIASSAIEELRTEKFVGSGTQIAILEAGQLGQSEKLIEFINAQLAKVGTLQITFTRSVDALNQIQVSLIDQGRHIGASGIPLPAEAGMKTGEQNLGRNPSLADLTAERQRLLKVDRPGEEAQDVMKKISVLIRVHDLTDPKVAEDAMKALVKDAKAGNAYARDAMAALLVPQGKKAPWKYPVATSLDNHLFQQFDLPNLGALQKEALATVRVAARTGLRDVSHRSNGLTLLEFCRATRIIAGPATNSWKQLQQAGKTARNLGRALPKSVRARVIAALTTTNHPRIYVRFINASYCCASGKRFGL